jgi:CheY-like chemotaxis protein
MANVMPNVCGVDACREIRAHEEAMHGERAFIIGMTGNTLSEDMAEFQESGCDVVMTKPIDWDAFKKILKGCDLITDQ